jgi:hypothetical protein
VNDEARSDLALALAALVFGPLLLGSLRGGSGLLGILADAGVVLALTALVPVLLARSRGDLAHAFAVRGADGARTDHPSTPPGRTGSLLAVPIAVGGTLVMLTAGVDPLGALLGRLSGSLLQVVPIAALSVGAFAIVVFVTTRARDAAMRSPLWTLRRLVRTLGMGAVAVGLVTGLLRVPLGASGVRVVVNALALACLVLIADRMVGPSASAPRLAVMLPAGLFLYLHITTFGLSIGIQAGALGGGVAVVMAVIALSRHGAAPLIPLSIALHLWPTCLSPLALTRGLC